MRNASNRVGTKDPQQGQPLSPCWLDGYRDVQIGIGFRKAYETWTPHEQRRYELGRLIATNIMAAGLVPPRLIKNRTAAYVEAITYAKETIGHGHIVADGKAVPQANERFDELVQVY